MYRVEVLFPAFLYKMWLVGWVGLEQGPGTIVFDIYIYTFYYFSASLVDVFLSNVTGGGGERGWRVIAVFYLLFFLGYIIIQIKGGGEGGLNR